MLTALKTKHSSLDFYFIIGSDNANCIQQWHRWQEVISMVPFIVIERQGSPLTATWCRQSPHYIVNLNIPEISSTEARAILHSGGTPPTMHPKVIDYIRHNGLYQ
jgi:nicotinate-nucleotide adenylyltransferase